MKSNLSPAVIAGILVCVVLAIGATYYFGMNRKADVPPIPMKVQTGAPGAPGAPGVPGTGAGGTPTIALPGAPHGSLGGGGQ